MLLNKGECRWISMFNQNYKFLAQNVDLLNIELYTNKDRYILSLWDNTGSSNQVLCDNLQGSDRWEVGGRFKRKGTYI